MSNFWEQAFKDKQEMWGEEPSKSSIIAKEFFIEQGVNKILIPGIGYGRNAKVFIDNNIDVTGIEISKTAIDLSKKYFENPLLIHQGSVTEMPFDQQKYDGIFCYSLIHLLSKSERLKFIDDCFNQLEDNGWMLFTTITKEASTYGQGIEIDTDTFELFGGVNIYFYDETSITEDFGNYGLFDIKKVEEDYPLYIIKCQKVR